MARKQTVLEIELVAIDTLTLDPENANGHPERNLTAIRNSLTKFGQRKPVVVWRDVVVAGNGTIESMIELGWTHASVTRCPTSWTIDKARAYALADNQTGKLSEWKLPVLDSQLAALSEIGWEMSALGFDAPEPAGFDLTDPDDVPEDAPAITKLGDVWRLGRHRVLCGDSTELLPTIDDGSVHLVATDPPYFRMVADEWDNQWGPDAKDFLDWMATWLAECNRAMADRGTIGVFCSPDLSAGVEIEIRRIFAVLNHIVWRKPGVGRIGMIDKDSMRRFFPTSERLILAEKCRNPDGDLFRFRDFVNHAVARDVYADVRQMLVNARDHAGLTNRQVDAALGTVGMAAHYFGGSQWALPTQEAWDKIVALAGDVQMPTWKLLRQEFDSRRREFDSRRREFDSRRREFDSVIESDLSLLGDVWTFAPPTKSERVEHSTQKPVDLMEHIIGTMSRLDDVVLDPFGGSGSTLIACENLGRICYMMELDPRYCDVICKRFQAHTGIVPILESTGEEVSFNE